MRVFTCALSLSLAVAGGAFARDSPPASLLPRLAAYVLSDKDLEDLRRGRVTVFAQSDPRWRRVRLGPRTIGSIGCTSTALASIAKDAGYDTDPARLVRAFSRSRLFTDEGEMIGLREPGRNFRNVFPELVVTDRVSGPHRVVMRRITSRLKKGEYVLLKINRFGDEHWVRAVGGYHGDLRIMDPAGGKIGYLSSLYGSTRVVREAVFIQKIG